jgi:hypothetical protein
MTTRPIIGLEAIHREYFISVDGQEILSFRSFRKLSKEMQEFGAVVRVTMKINGKKRARIVALEPFFSLWRRELLCGHRKKDEMRFFMGGQL